MRKNIQRIVLGTSLLALVLAITSLPVHAEAAVTPRADKASYAPGDSGTVTFYIVNTSGNPIAIRNITVYYPWAQYDTNGKWLANANFTNNFTPPVALAAAGADNFSYTTPSFIIPTWWGINSVPQYLNCGNPTSRFGLHSGCIYLGQNATNNRYEGFSFGVSMAQAFYNPSSLSTLSEWIPIAELAVLVVATVFLAMAWMSLRKLSKK